MEKLNWFFLLCLLLHVIMVSEVSSSVGFTPARYSIQPIFGQRKSSYWLIDSVWNVFESFQHPEDSVYILQLDDKQIISGPSHYMIKLNTSNGEVNLLLENIASIAKPINMDGHDIFYFIENVNTQCLLSKFNATSQSKVKIAGSTCDISGSPQYTRPLNEMEFSVGGLLSVYKNHTTIHIYYSTQQFYIYLIDESIGMATLIQQEEEEISSLRATSNDELYIASLYRIRKLFSNGNVTTIFKTKTEYSIINAFELDPLVVNNTETFYYGVFQDNQLFKSTVEYSPQNSIVNLKTELMSGYYYTVGTSGDGGYASDAQISYLFSTSLINGKLWLVGSNISGGFKNLGWICRQIDLKSGIISTLFTDRGMRLFNKNGNEMIPPFLLRSPKDLIYSYNNGSPVLYISEYGSASILKYSLVTGSVENIGNVLIPLKSDEIFKATPIISSSNYMAFDRNSNLIVSNSISYWTSNFLVKFDGINTSNYSILFGNKLFPSYNDIRTDTKSAVLSRPSGVTSLQNEKGIFIFITDSNNNRVLMLSNGTTSTIANQREHGINAPYGITAASDYGLVFFSDYNNHCIRAINLTDLSVYVFAGQPGIKGFTDGHLLNSTFNYPAGISYDNSILYIADSNNHAVRSISITDKSVRTIAGTGQPGFNGDGKLPLETQFNTPMGIVCSTAFGILIADSGNHRIRNIIEDNFVKTIAGSNIDGSGGDEGPAIKSQLFYPHSVTVGDTHIYIADTFNNKIRAISFFDFSISTVISETGFSGLEGDGNLGIMAKLNGPVSIHSFTDSLTRKSQLLIADTRNDRVRVYYSDTMIIETLTGGLGDGGLSENAIGNCLGVTIGQNNDIYLTDVKNNLIRRIRNGIITTIAGNGGFGFNADNINSLQSTLATPSGIAYSEITGNLIFSDTNNHRIRVIYKNGNISTIAGTGIAGFSGDGGLAVNAMINSPTYLKLIPPYDIIVFSDSKNSRIRRIQNGIITTIAGNGELSSVYSINESPASNVSLGAPEGISFSNDGNGEFYISDSKFNIIQKMKPYCQEGFVLSINKVECIPVCFGKLANESDACNYGNGSCIDYNKCECISGFNGLACQTPICYGIPGDLERVCSFNGSCILPNTCECNTGYRGSQCEIPICFGKSDEKACNTNGVCVKYNQCQCKYGYSGTECERNDISLAVVLGLIGFFGSVILIISIVLFILARVYRKQKKILDTDLTLGERLLAQTEDGTTHSSIQSSDNTNTSNSSEENKFIIPIEQLNMDKPIKRLGEGGMGQVFLTKYNGMMVAVKVFDLNNFNISEDDFKIEAILLSKLRHPNIINFYGISSTPTKRFICMECMDKSLESLIASLQRGQLTCSLKEKLSILVNVASGINYLHHLEPNYIVHRDLKPANILLDKNGNAKLCDFGLGRALSNNTASAITSHIGTHNYMSPELFSGDIGREEARSIDIYSLSIIMWQVLFEVIDPYQSTIKEVLQKLKLSEPTSFKSAYHFHKSVCEDGVRPIIPFSNIQECKLWCNEFIKENQTLNHCKVIYELCLIIQQAWKHDAKERPNIKEIVAKLEEWQELLLN